MSGAFMALRFVLIYFSGIPSSIIYYFLTNFRTFVRDAYVYFDYNQSTLNM